MSNNLQLAVNHAIYDAVARKRMMLANPSMGLDAKRASAWCEYGFKDELDFHDFYKLYKRGGIAFGAVDKLITTCWKTYPQIIEGDKYDKSKKETAWERSNKKIFNRRFWFSVAKADRRRLVGRYSGLILHIKDNSQTWNKPVQREAELEKLTPVWASALKVAEWNTDLNSKDYGKPKMWQYTEKLDNNSTRVIDIHPDRIFILGDYSDDAIGFLEPAYNAFVSLEKVEGGSGESFLKNAARQLSVSFDKEVDFNNLASLYGVSVDELQEKFNEIAKELNRGNDVMLTTQGANVTPLVTGVADPQPTYNVNLQTASAAVDIPSRILVGNQQGERASTEDKDYFNARCQSRRENDIALDIEDLVNHLIKIKVVKPVSEKTVIWDDLTEQSPSQKLESAVKMSQVNQTSLATGEAVFSVDEVREVAGYDPLETPLTEEVEDEEKDKTAD